VDHAIAPGVDNDMGPGDEWPEIRRKALGADILLVSTPVWLGHPSSIAQRVLERLDAELSNTDDNGHQRWSERSRLSVWWAMRTVHIRWSPICSKR
jgi:multimeric flavodoxin WrbA